MSEFVIRKTNFKELKKRLKSFNYDGVEIILGNNGMLKNSILEYAKLGDCFIGLKDDEMLGCGGIVEFYPKYGYLWLLMNKSAQFYLKSIISFMKSFFDDLLINRNFIRLQCFCFVDIPQAQKFLEYLKFKQEGKLRKFLQEKDCFIYSLLKEDLYDGN